MTDKIMIVKRDGRSEEFDPEKIHKVLKWASEGLDNISISEIEMKAQVQILDGTTTEDIHEAMIKSAADIATISAPDYTLIAGRLNTLKIRKMVYGTHVPLSLYNHVVKMTKAGLYDPAILESYTETEMDKLDAFLQHKRDFDISYSGSKQLENKYLVQNRVTGAIYESPNMSFMVLSMTSFMSYTGDVRMRYVTAMYDGVSTFKISLPTPIMSGLRTTVKQFSSCVTIDVADSLSGIKAATSSVIDYISRKAGIGLNIGRIRAEGSVIRNGDARHTGMVPFIKLFQSAVKSCSQGGVRGGAATAYYPIWHLEFMSLVVLKNNRGIDENRARHLDYAVQICKLFYKRLQTDGDITLFSPVDVPGLYDAFFEDQDLFEEMYLKYEADESIRKKTYKATEIFVTLAQERAGTGRIYIYNTDNVTNYGPFDPKKAPVRMSNLCLEIALPTVPLDGTRDDEGEIALCTLAAVNVGNVNGEAEYEKWMDVLVRALDNLLTYQDYPTLTAEVCTKSRRPLGIGIIGLAHAFAKRGLKYSDGSANEYVHTLMERIQYYGLKASAFLAAEIGRCDAYEDTRYSKGHLPVNWYNKRIDKLTPNDLKCDWDGLAEYIQLHGLRNSTITALMPSETSSQVSGATNGIEPPRGPITVKASKEGTLKQIVPGISALKDKYEYLWDIPNNKGYLEIVAILQKFTDQSISANTNYDPNRYKDGRVPVKEILADLMVGYSYGIKTFYYHNTRDGSTDDTVVEDSGCEDGACKI